jgi:hypothetical protein
MDRITSIEKKVIANRGVTLISTVEGMPVAIFIGRKEVNQYETE